MKRSTIWMLVGGLLAGTVVWWMFLMSPERSSAADAREELEMAQLREATIRTQIAQLSDIIDTEISYRFAIGEMETAVPVQPQADVFIEDLTFLAESTGVDIFSFALSRPTPIEFTAAGQVGLEAYAVTVTVSAQGQYFEVLGFLYGLEAMDRLVRVDSIGLSPGQEAEEPEQPPEEPEEDGTTTTTTTIAEPRLRPEPDVLAVQIAMRIFTRSAADVPDTSSVPADGGSAEIESGEESTQ